MEYIKLNFPLKGVVESRIGGRDENQDSYGYRDVPMGAAIVVCDGMGGAQGGKYASMIAVNAILDYLSQQDENCDTVNALHEAISYANMLIIQTGMENPSLYGMGTTVTALLLNKQCATVAYVGDSRIYQLRGKKKAFRTTDHSMVFEMVKGGVMTEEQARLSNQSNVILRALGINTEVEADIYKLPYLENDRFILCSDGFWGAMPEPEFLKLVTKKEYLGYLIETTANRVDAIGNAKGGHHDNLTAAVIDVKCNSKMKVKMSKLVKILLCVLTALLCISVALNIYCVCKLSQKKTAAPKTEQVADTPKEDKDGSVEDKSNTLKNSNNSRNASNEKDAAKPVKPVKPAEKKN